MRTRRVILVCTGALCGPHQRSHKCAWVRTTSSGTRGHGRRVEPCEVIGSSSIRRATYEHSLWGSKNHDATEQHFMQRVFCPCLLTCQHAATALPRLPCHTPSCCALLYRGCALLTRPVQDAPRSQHPPGPPGRLRLHSVCVCVLVDVMSQCRLMCLLLSGRLPFAKR